MWVAQIKENHLKVEGVADDGTLGGEYCGGQAEPPALAGLLLGQGVRQVRGVPVDGMAPAGHIILYTPDKLFCQR